MRPTLPPGQSARLGVRGRFRRKSERPPGDNPCQVWRSHSQPRQHLHLASRSIIRNLVSMRVFDVETNWVGQVKSFVHPLEQKDARKEAKSLIYDGGLSLKDAMARTEATRS